MNENLYLIKEGEISLKGGNRIEFERKLRGNIRHKLKPFECKIESTKGRVYLYTDPSCPEEKIEMALNTTFGITGWAKAEKTKEKTLPSLEEKLNEILLQHPFNDNGTFKIDSMREDKTFPLSSHELNLYAADIVEKYYPSLGVDLKHPDYTITIEVRKEIYIYISSTLGQGGLPVGIAGRGILLLSGGIDSPVAGYKMAKRGVKLDALYFHSYPYTSDQAKEKVKTLSSIIAPFLQGLRLFVIPFTKVQEKIRDQGEEDEATLHFRVAMIKSAEKIAEREHDSVIVTGEAVSQVASQTLDAMSYTTSFSSKLILRPLCGMDKEEIINESKRIGTFDTSILPYEDCCVVFSPKHPVTRPKGEKERKNYLSLELDDLIDEAIKNTECYVFDDNGIESVKEL